MQSSRPMQPRGELEDVVPFRPASGGSTTSSDSIAVRDTSFANDPRFAPIRPDSQASQTESDTAAHALEHFAATALHGQKGSQGSATFDPRLHASRSAAQAQQFNHVHAEPNNAYHAADRINERHISAPPRARTSTPQLGGNATGTDVEKKEKKGPSTTAANEKELRELLDRNGSRDLGSIAKEVRTAERSQKAERAKQLYAMRWLQQFCRQGKDSVPRNRVYTHYAQRCGTDRVDTLNPASFGKLVRIIFPGIQTRRLGQRGESKYHYVNLTLVDENSASMARMSGPHDGAFHGLRAESVDDFDFKTSSRIPADSTVFPSHGHLFDQPQTMSEGNPFSQGLTFADSQVGLRFDVENAQMYSQTIKFGPAVEQTLSDQPLVLPSIHPFLPSNTDFDLAEALNALYRTHCTSLMDAMRFVREKSFFRLFGTFGGTLTVPVTRLFTNPSIAPWIKLCDWHVYQQIIRFVSQLALQVIPAQVWSLLHRVTNELTDHIVTHFSQYPPHVLEAKLEPATIFSKLLQRLLRVNETAHAAANLLISDEIRNMMWQDWVKTVRPRRVAETELPACGYEEVTNILTSEIRTLLEPLDETAFPEVGTEFETAKFQSRTGHEMANLLPTSENVLERWSIFLKSLPGRFPRTQTRLLLHSISAVGSGTLRDITVGQSPSFGSWWITKCWVDEMMLWLAEMGGFLESRPSAAPQSPQHAPSIEAFTDSGRPDSKQSLDPPHSAGLGIDFSNLSHFSTVQDRGLDSADSSSAPFRFPAKMNGKPNTINFDIHEDGNDDSGIGMSLLSNNAYDFTT